MLMKCRTAASILALLALWRLPVVAQTARTRIAGPINDSQMQRLARNTHPLARPEFDRGLAPAALPMERMLLVLTPSVDRQQGLETLLRAQQDKTSPQYHKWLTPQQFGQQFGVADADVAQVTAWLQSHGFTVGQVADGRNLIEFSGTAAQVQTAFHTEIHHYLVNGQDHWANATDPQIPVALAPVVAGVATLHNFRKSSQISNIRPQAVKLPANGGRPEFTASDGIHALAPGDFATIYHLPTFYTGAGTSIAVVARTNILISDLQSFQGSFSVPYVLPQIVLNGSDPGDLGDGDEAEAVLDVSWSSALAPAAKVSLVVSGSTAATDGVDLSEEYIVNHNLADVMSESYGDCEANFTRAEAQFYSMLAQQAAAQGITYAVAAGDSGAEGCDDPGSVTVASRPASVNLLAATPYDVAVGGTMFHENGNPAYWQTFNFVTFSSAASYIPEVAWNESCTAAVCGSNANIDAGGGGASALFGKPSWQTGVAGIPNDGARDVPDISFTSAGHDFYLLCLDGSCTSQHGESFFSGVSGTSAATPSFAAIMALVVQATGSRQGLANPTLYRLAGTESLGACNAASPGSDCIFNDVTVGNNAVPGELGYGAPNAAYQAGVGYDLATGLGSANVNNLVDSWNSTPVSAPQVRIGIDAPSALNGTVIGDVTFSGWALADTGGLTALTLTIDSVPYGEVQYGGSRPDICALYSSANCPGVGWTFPVNTTLLPNGPHTVALTATSSTGLVYTQSAAFTVDNWVSANPMKISIDRPAPSSPAFSGVAFFGGWALDDLAAISQITVAIDGASSGPAIYGGSRTDVCSALPGRPGCPNVGWNVAVDTTALADGPHTLTVTGLTTGGQTSSVAATFTVANTPVNTIAVTIDSPASGGPPLSGVVGFGGWATGTAVPISSVAASIDGISLGNAFYGGARTDVCSHFPNRPSCPNVGWNLGVDTTQLVNGAHLLTITTYAGATQHSVTTRVFNVLNATPATPVAMSIDTPGATNGILLGAATFTGWAVNSAAPVTGVSVSIDGAFYGMASYGASRPDVCAAFPSNYGCPDVGWSLPLDTTRLANGAHTVTINALGNPQNGLTGTFTVANWTNSNPMKASIDAPNPQAAPLKGSVNIGGWVADELSPVTQASLSVDGVPIGNAAYGGARSDVCRVFPSAQGCPNVGWNYVLDTNLLSDGTHNMGLTGTTAAGQSASFSTTFQVANLGATPVRVSIDRPSSATVLTGAAAVGGWALDTSGAAIASVVVLIDGELNGTAIYGGARTDVCAHIPTGGGCPNVGWNYVLDTTPFANGTHTIQVRALAADGNLYTGANTFTIANSP